MNFVAIMYVNLGPVCLLESSFCLKVNSEKVDYFSMFSRVIENKLENNFQFGYVMENELKNNLLMFYFFQVY